ncbi:diaminopimelate epimerase [Ghiorsea bivora]|uniref:diaminopimelate epimerase n=1 Tax=Ghiorsea bivora TaxID=1485545 RepID=UPI00057064D1|nr:diaminopimelate epimerase [Ghiorsea bivora]
MTLPFVKMQAQGNDFVILNGMIDTLPALTQAFVTKVCDRHMGIGCDQLLVLQPHHTADALMLIYNADGSIAANCGNGLRCVGDLLMRQTGEPQVSIALADRIVSAEYTTDGVQVVMGEFVVEQVTKDYTDVLVGNPHRVYFSHVQACPERNVEIISDYDESHVNIRIIERGAGETLACGSGACATAAAVWQRLDHVSPLEIQMPGGNVKVHQLGTELLLTGFVTYVFDGQYDCI